MNQLQSGRDHWQPRHPAGFDLAADGADWRLHDAEAARGARDLLLILRRSAGPILLWVLACIGCAILYLRDAAPEYVATTQIILEPRRPPVGVLDLAASSYGATLDSAQADSQVQVAKSERTLRFVFDELKLADDPVFAREDPGLLAPLEALFGIHPAPSAAAAADREALAHARAFQAFSDRISVRRIGQSYILEISFRAPGSAMAAKLANAITAAYIRDNIVYGAAAMQRGTELLQDRIAEIKAEQDAAADAVRNGVLPDQPFPDSEARIVSTALPPLGKAYPQSRLILLLAATFGLLSGAGVSLARHSLDRTVRSRRQVGRAFNLDHLSTVPRFQRRAGRRFGRRGLSFTSVIDADSSDFAEALRGLRTTLLTARTASRHIAIGIVSWSPGEGRSSIASNLAILVAASNEAVVLVDGDFRNPALSRALAPDATVGLDEALLSHVAASHPLATPLNPTLDIVPAVAGGRTSNPNVFIGSDEMDRMLRALREDRDVIVDLPPLSLSSDTQAVAHLLDGVVVVVEANRTTFDELREALDALKAAEARVLRVVLNKARPAATATS